jgi:hypothetical protein
MASLGLQRVDRLASTGVSDAPQAMNVHVTAEACATPQRRHRLTRPIRRCNSQRRHSRATVALNVHEVRPMKLALSVIALASLGLISNLAHARGGLRPSKTPDGVDIARGTVFLDANGNGRFDRAEHGIKGVSVSNGLDVVQTDGRGEYRIALPPESFLFISKPAEYEVPVDPNNLPQFYYTHYPDGTPPVADWQNPVIEPTGPLPKRVDFPLLPGVKGVSEFKVMGFADTQAGTHEEEDGVREDIVAPIINNPYGASFGFVAGDVVNDNLSLFPRHNEIMGKIGIPIWNVPGNHDTNNEAPLDRYATQTYSRYYGPTDFSFNHGDTHWIGADNIDDGDDDRPSQGCVLNEQQLTWLKNDLKFVPKDKLIVIVTHCPLITYALDQNGERYTLGGNINTINLAQIVEILKPFPRVYWIAGHDTSNSWKVQLNHTHNWHGEWFMAHTLAEVRGNGWSTGPRTERDTRTVNMQDGNPNGYYVMTFKGTSVKPKFYPGKGDPNQSMRIVLDPLPLGTRDEAGTVLAINRGPLAPNSKVIVNLFDGGDQDVVQLSLDGAPWVKLQNVLRTDPFQERQYAQYRGTDSAVGRPEPSSHIWEYPLSPDLAPGVHTVEVMTRDNFGQEASDSFSFEVLPAPSPAEAVSLSAARIVAPAPAPDKETPIPD